MTGKINCLSANAICGETDVPVEYGEAAKVKEDAWAGKVPTIRLHLWLETPDGIFFGAGRALLLAKIEECGSLSKAAEALGMSYRAAWGKIRRTEKILGVKLIVQNGCKKEGHRLTEHGRIFKEKYFLWLRETERWAMEKAREIFPWSVQSFKTKAWGRMLQLLLGFTVAYSPLEELIVALA
jgi:molybdate transport system regulatory protein